MSSYWSKRRKVLKIADEMQSRTNIEIDTYVSDTPSSSSASNISLSSKESAVGIVTTIVRKNKDFTKAVDNDQCSNETTNTSENLYHYPIDQVNNGSDDNISDKDDDGGGWSTSSLMNFVNFHRKYCK